MSGRASPSAGRNATAEAPSRPVAQLEHGRQHRPEPGVVGDLGAVHRHVQVTRTSTFLPVRSSGRSSRVLKLLTNRVHKVDKVRTRYTCASAGRQDDFGTPHLNRCHRFTIRAKPLCRTDLSKPRPSPRRCRPWLREAPFVVVPADDPDQLAFERRRLEAVDRRACACVCMMSIETKGSSLYSRRPFTAPFRPRP